MSLFLKSVKDRYIIFLKGKTYEWEIEKKNCSQQILILMK